MALLSILFNSPTRAVIGAMQLDASLSENHAREADVTENEVEDGTVISDHIRLKPKRLTIEGLVSDAPLSVIGSALGAGIGIAQSRITERASGLLGGALASVAGDVLGSIAGLVTGSPRDPNDAFKYLEELWRNREPFDVVTALDVYSNMVITSINVPRSATIGKSLRFTIELREIRIVSSAVVRIPAFQLDPTASGAQSQAGLGRQGQGGIKEAVQGQVDDITSIFKGDGTNSSLAKKLGGLFGGN